MNKLYNGIMGLVVGDALGVPFEFRERDTFHCTDMTGYGTYNQPPGTWSDDSSMTLATLQSLVDNKGKIVLFDIIQNFICWYMYGKFTPHGKVFDVGVTTRNAIFKYFNAKDILNCGCKEFTDNGNGSLMRILPLAFVRHSTDDIRNVSALTHAHEISMTACIIYLDIAAGLLTGFDKYFAVTMAKNLSVVTAEFERIEAINNGLVSRDEIKSTGYVVDTLEAALWCLLNTDSYKDCVLTAVNLGGDTDTIAAVAGGLAGILYGVGGEKGIPEEWIEQIEKRDWIANLCSFNF